MVYCISIFIGIIHRSPKKVFMFKFIEVIILLRDFSTGRYNIHPFRSFISIDLQTILFSLF